MSKKTIKALCQYGVEWLGMPASERDAHMVGSLISGQFNETKSSSNSLIQEILPNIFLLTIIEPKEDASLNIKKISDRVQYGMLPDKFNNEVFVRLSYFNLRNLCHLEEDCSWAQALGAQIGDSSKVHAIFFYNFLALDRLWNRLLVDGNFLVKEQLSNRLLIISDGSYHYPYNLGKVAAFALWRQHSIEKVAHHEMQILKKRFVMFPKIYHALSKSEMATNWQLNDGAMTFICSQEEKKFDYASIVDDILHADEEHNIPAYLKRFNIKDLNSRSAFPTIAVRSLVHLRARPDALCALQNGFALCAALEENGKQRAVETSNAGGSQTFNLWLKRSQRHLYHHQYQARVVFTNEQAANAFSLVGEQIASIATFPKLIKGVLEQLNLGAHKKVRLIAHNEDVLTIASEQASWNEINEVNRKAMSLFKMISSDGTDPLSLFELIELPANGVGAFHLSMVPEEYFELIDTALTLKFSLPPGHDHYLLGLSYECLREYGMAVNEFEKALRLDSHDTSILNALGSSLMEMGRFEQALPFLKRAYETLPEDADLANTVGRLHLNFGNVDEAITAFERAVRLSPGSADFLSNLGNGYLLAARSADALEILNKAIRCDPAFATAHERLAELHLQYGDEELAKKHALIAYRENPNDTNVANLLWRLTVGKKDKCNG